MVFFSLYGSTQIEKRDWLTKKRNSQSTYYQGSSFYDVNTQVRISHKSKEFFKNRIHVL